ncbi:MAG: hypothetical protein H6818_02710 [Phycisphaerales bacterium]|nr:hypothetical protein [Phycisphaerales bacterium]MCB9863227.1 hypothetical protein [Phycisphaerales bacterium]
MQLGRIMIILAPVILFAGCQGDVSREGSQGKTPDAPVQGSPTEDLRDAATTLWSARVARDYATIYRFQPASYRASVDCDSFVRNGADNLFHYLEFELEDVENRDDVGWVQLRSQTALAKFADIPARSITRWETWIRETGRWRPCTPEESDALPRAPSLRSTECESALRERFLEYGQARVSADFEAMYACLDPAGRAKMPYAEFAESEAVLRILAAEPEWVEVIGNAGRVRAAYLVASADPSLSKLSPKIVRVTELWRKEGATWFRDVPI